MKKTWRKNTKDRNPNRLHGQFCCQIWHDSSIPLLTRPASRSMMDVPRKAKRRRWKVVSTGPSTGFQCHMVVKTLVGTRYIKAPQVIAGIAGCLFPQYGNLTHPHVSKDSQLSCHLAKQRYFAPKRSRGHQSPHDRSVSSSSHSINLITVYQVVCHFHLLFLVISIILSHHLPKRSSVHILTAEERTFNYQYSTCRWAAGFLLHEC